MTRSKPRRMKSSVDPAVLEPLGRVVVNFNLLESMLSLSICQLLGCEQRIGQCVTEQLAFKGLLNAFCSLYRLRASDPNIVASVQSLRTRFEAAEQKRNELLHSIWMMGPTKGLSTRVKYRARAKKGWTVHLTDMSAADVAAVADEMEALTSEVPTLLSTFLRSLPKQTPSEA